MRQYVIHIGMPKTGTKYLQQSFTQRGAELLRHGIYYPIHLSKDPIATHHAIWHGLVAGEDLSEVFAVINKNDAPTVLLSSEGFQGLNPAQIATLRNLTSNAPTKIVVFLRRWSDWIFSQWQQAIRQGAISSIHEYYAETIGNAEGHPGINNTIILNRFREVFGNDSICILPYSTLMDEGRDIFVEFAREALGLDLRPALAKPALVHESMDVFLTELTRCMNAIELRAGRVPSHKTSTAIVRLGDHATVRQIYDVMKGFVATIEISDLSSPLRRIFANLNGEYGNRLACASRVFEPKSRHFDYVRSDFMIALGMSASVNHVHGLICGDRPACLTRAGPLVTST